MPLPDNLVNAFSARSPIDIDCTPFVFSLAAFRESFPHEVEAIHLAFTASNGATHYDGQLHLGKDRYTDAEIADLAVGTIRDIAAGNLPPGTNSPV